MSGGYGPGYPGQGYDEDPDQTRPRRPGGGPQQRDGSVWQNDQGYDAPGYDAPGYGGQEFAGPGYREPGYGPGHQGEPYGAPGRDPRGYGQPDGPGRPGRRGGPGDGPPYPPGDGGYGYQGTGPRPGQYGTGGMPQQYDQHDQRQYEQRGTGPRRGQGGRGRRAYGDWEQEDSSFLPGFDRGEEPNAGRAGGYAPERDGRPDGYDGRPAPRGGRAGARPPEDWAPDPGGRGPRGPVGRGPGDRGPGGPGPRGPGGRGDDPDGPRFVGAWDDRDRKPRKKVTRWFPRILVLSVVAVIVIGGLVGGLTVYGKYQARYHPADYAGQGTGDVVFQVKSGDTAFSIAPRLLQLGVIASTRAFTNAAENATTTTSTNSAGLEAGFYNLHTHMQASLAYTDLVNPKNAIQAAVTVPEGERVSQVLSILAAHTKIPLGQFEAAAKETSKLGLPSYAGTTAKLPSTVPYGQLEGYLFPATYTVTPHETALQVLQAMVQRFDVEAQGIDIQQAAQSVNLTANQLIIEASMVQAEAGLNSDMPKMASVIVNRTKAGMPDGFDSVVFYGLGKYGINIPNGLSPATAGPYDNTQKVGLPPTPIDNPGNTAIQAVLHPVKSDWLYFLTVATGKATEFSANCQDLPGTC
ncbi:MAG TPA: endolytic transglycosylase MltG [Trebonia sp.]